MTSKQNKTDRKNTALLPVRYFLDAKEVASCFSALGKGHPKSGLFSSLPKTTERLPNTVSDKHGKLSPEARKLFLMLADPKTIMTIEIIPANSRYGVRLNFIIDQSGTFFVAVSQEPDGTWDLALLTGVDQLLSVINELTGLSHAAQGSGGYQTTLSIPGLAALAAFSDFLRQAQLQSELDRSALSIEHLLSPIIVADLAQMIAVAIEKPDMRSAVSKVAYCCDGAILAVKKPEALEKGVKQLVQAGLVDEDHVVTGDGLALAKGLSQASAIVSIAVADIGRKTLLMDRLTLVILPDAILAGVWQLGKAGELAALTFAEMHAAAILSLIRELTGQKRKTGNSSEKKKGSAPSRPSAQPAPGTTACTRCGHELKSGVKFCTNCGAKI